MSMERGGPLSRAGGLTGWETDCLSDGPTLPSLIAGPVREREGSPAILAPARRPLSYGRLAQIIDEYLREVRGAGIGAQDRIAVVLPNGPEMAVALLATMTAGAAAPLNPNLSDEEFDFCLADLEARALLIQAETDSPARDAARARGIPVIDLHPDFSGEAGSFRLDVPVVGPPSVDRLPHADDIALLLHTSGTTSKPKLVPLTQSNLHFSALNIRAGLGLTSEDCCLNVMPLFHIHGLVAALLSSLAAGGSVVCTPGFLANEFFGWLKDFSPTWYTAVPTIHQSVLARSIDFKDVLETHRLRFIRSCSASLSPSVMSDLEKHFRVPVVEAYGMTEASHQMASNPLPPLPRKPGSVGLPTGVEFAILDESGASVPAGKSGEIAIRGRTVTSGYLKNREANAGAFSGEWLRTGDIGYVDTDGYLFLSGRSKEMINRGGEKVSPREVEEVVLTHPDVAQAAAFGLPDERLGEEVAVAVVLRPGAAATETEIRSHAAGKLAYFRVPKRVIFVDQIPKGPTGKIQRIGLAEKLHLSFGTQRRPGVRSAGSDHPEPASGMEKQILRLMQKSAGGGPMGVDESYFEAGGDSIQAAVFLAEVKKRFGVDIPLAAFTVNATARHVSGVIGGRAAPASTVLVPVKKSGGKIPFFCVHPHDGRVAVFFPMAERFDGDQPFYAFQALSEEDLHPTAGGIERLARKYVSVMKAFRPAAPYLIGGYCFGALIAFEMACILSRQCERVAFLALIDSYAPGGPEPSSHGPVRGALYGFLDRARRVRPLLDYISHFPPGQRKQYLLSLVRSQVSEWRSFARRNRSLRPRSYSLPGRENDLDWQFHPGPYAGSAVLFRPISEPLGFKKDPAMGWSRFIDGRLDIERINGYHRSLIFKPHHELLAERLNYQLHKCQQPG